MSVYEIIGGIWTAIWSLASIFFFAIGMTLLFVVTQLESSYSPGNNYVDSIMVHYLIVVYPPNSQAVIYLLAAIYCILMALVGFIVAKK